MVAIGERPVTRSVAREFDDVAASYRSECAHGVPMSVHERCERRLASLRGELRSRHTPERLGEVLRGMGVLSDKQLGEALGIQREGGRTKLLGEILIDLGWVDEEAIRRAVEAQNPLISVE